MTIVITLAMLMMNTTVATAQSTGATPLSVQAASTVWIDGSSNVRDWSCKAAASDARVDVDSAYASQSGPGAAESIQRVTVKVAVRDLKCGNGRMENDLYRALKAGDSTTSSEIHGVFNASRRAEAHGSTLETAGTITVAGVAKDVHVRITIEQLADGTVKARGSVPLLMTDFGVKPPTGLLGLVRSHNEVTVRFEIVLAAHGRVVVGGG
jgi:polyisoprenoid-binding protein YceI